MEIEERLAGIEAGVARSARAHLATNTAIVTIAIAAVVELRERGAEADVGKYLKRLESLVDELGPDLGSTSAHVLEAMKQMLG